jgi:hypothetical protein
LNQSKVRSCKILIKLILLLAVPALACNIPEVVSDTPLPQTHPITANTSTPTNTFTPTNTLTPEPTPLPPDLVWFAPNFGSRDYLELFTKPEQWSVARSRIHVFQFYADNVIGERPCPLCGDNSFDAFVRAGAFQKLTDWDLAISIELGPIYPDWDCSGDIVFRNADQAVRNIEANGGVVRLWSMDEPFIYGQLDIKGQKCGYDIEETAAITLKYIERLTAAHPLIRVGDIEPYPHFSIPQLKEWILALEDKGVSLAFFHLDVDTERVRVEGQNVAADLNALDQFCQEHQIPFGVILTSNWTAAGSNRTYFDSTMDWVRTVNEAMGKPQHVIFQSWQGPAPSGAHEIPINLPQNDPDQYSHIRLIIEGLDAFDK